MAFRFSKRIKVAPGIRLNVSKRGLSVSLGGRGGTVNLSSRGVRTTVGIPGTGLSWSHQSGLSGAKGLKPADQLLRVGNILDGLAAKFNSLSPRANTVTDRWNKAVVSFSGGRGPSLAKFGTLEKRFKTAIDGYQKVNEKAAEHQDMLDAISEHLNEMTFGWFSGSLKSARDDLLALVREHKSCTRELTDATARLSLEIGNELAGLRSSID